MSSASEIKKERGATESSAQSSITNAPSVAHLERDNHHASNDQETSNQVSEKFNTEETNLDNEGQYRHGVKLFFIVLALGMSIFLVALDMVCRISYPYEERPL